jgi:hypothetical protein
MTKDEALRIALEALKQCNVYAFAGGLGVRAMEHTEAMEAIKEALAQPELLTEAKIQRGLMALLQCSASELDSYSCLLLDNYTDDVKRVVLAVNQTSPRPEQEPVATKTEKGIILHVGWDDLPADTKLYTSPPKREWVGLTDDERAECWRSSAKQSAINIEAKLKELNHD